MKLEQNDSSMLFSSTSIPDVFFTEYLSLASGDYLKVYLFLLFLSKHDKDIKLNDLSKKLSLPFKTIQDAIKFWEDLGLIIKKPTGYSLANVQEVELLKLYTPKLTSSPEDIKKNAKNQYRAKAIENINTQYFQGLMPLSFYTDIDMWFKKYGFDEQVMIALFGYCFDKSALNRNYIQAVADGWSQNNIRTYNDLDAYFEKREKVNNIKKLIVKKLRLFRALTEFEDAFVTKWVIDYNYNFDIIELALKKTTSKSNPDFNYINSIIENWRKNGLKTVAEIQEYSQKFKKAPQAVKKENSNFTSRQYDNLDDFYINPTENKQTND